MPKGTGPGWRDRGIALVQLACAIVLGATNVLEAEQLQSVIVMNLTIMPLTLVPQAAPGGGTPSDRQGAALSRGATASAPAQRTSAAAPAVVTSADTAVSAAGRRRTPRPRGAVADQPSPPPTTAKPESPARVHVSPEVRQRADLPAIDPQATERTRDRTATTETFDNPDGSRTLRIHTGTHNVRRPDGNWRTVDLRLTGAAGGRRTPRTSPVGVSFAPTAPDPALARIDLGGGRTAGYSLRGAADATGEAAGPAITYRQVRPGVDLRLAATTAGVKEDLVLTSAKAPAS